MSGTYLVRGFQTVLGMALLAPPALPARAPDCDPTAHRLLADLQAQVGDYRPTEAALSGLPGARRAKAGFKPASPLAFALLAARISEAVAERQSADRCLVHCFALLKAVEGHVDAARSFLSAHAKGAQLPPTLDNDLAGLQWEARGPGSGLVRLEALDRWLRLSQSDPLPEVRQNLAMAAAGLNLDPEHWSTLPPTTLVAPRAAPPPEYDSAVITEMVDLAHRLVSSSTASTASASPWATALLQNMETCDATCRARLARGLDQLDQGSRALAQDALSNASALLRQASTSLTDFPLLARVAQLQLGRALANAGDVAAAAPTFLVLQAPPLDVIGAWAARHSGVAAMLLGKPREAFDHLDAAGRAFDRIPDREGLSSAKAARADLLRSTGRISESIDLFVDLLANQTSGPAQHRRLLSIAIDTLYSTPLDIARGAIASTLAVQAAQAGDRALQGWALLMRTAAAPAVPPDFLARVEANVAGGSAFSDLGRRMHAERLLLNARDQAGAAPVEGSRLARLAEEAHDNADRRTEARLVQAGALRRLGRARDALDTIRRALAHSDAFKARTPPIPDRQGQLDPVRRLYAEALGAAADAEDWEDMFAWADAFSEFSLAAMGRSASEPPLPATVTLPKHGDVLIRVECLPDRCVALAASAAGLRADVLPVADRTPTAEIRRRLAAELGAETSAVGAILRQARLIVPLTSTLSPGFARAGVATAPPAAATAIEARSARRWNDLRETLDGPREWRVTEQPLLNHPGQAGDVLLFDGHFAFDQFEPLRSFFSTFEQPDRPSLYLHDLSARFDRSILALLACDAAGTLDGTADTLLTPARAVLAAGGLAVLAPEGPVPDDASRSYRRALLAGLRGGLSFRQAHSDALESLRRTPLRNSFVLWL